MADRLTLPQPGDVIAGKYRIDHPLGTGGMGAVFQATHRVTGKRFAVKWLLPEVSGQGDAAQRFIREAQVAGRFEHPHVVEVYDLGNDGGSFYMVMELLEGESLGERVERTGPMTVADTCRLLIPCMHGVAEAHAAGIVHRDLKPANLFVCHATKQRRECAKVLDFGISKISGLPGGDLNGGMTKSGTLIGTPHYMPLEQMRGRGVDHRADIYSFGVVIYQVLSGKLPYPADSFSDLVLMLAHETPAPLERIVPRLPRGLAQIVSKAMAREPADRFQSLDELIIALEPYADPSSHISVNAESSSRPLNASLSLPTPLSTESRVRAKAGQAAPVLRYAIVGGAVLLLAGGAVFWLQRGAESAQHDTAQPVHTATPAPQPQAAEPAKPAEPAAQEPDTQRDQALAPAVPAAQPAAAEPTPTPVAAPLRPRPKPASAAPPEPKHAALPTHVRPPAPEPGPTPMTVKPIEGKAKSASGRVPAINESDFY